MLSLNLWKESINVLRLNSLGSFLPAFFLFFQEINGKYNDSTLQLFFSVLLSLILTCVLNYISHFVVFHRFPQLFGKT